MLSVQERSAVSVFPEGQAVSTLFCGRIVFVCADIDSVKGTVVAVDTMVNALVNGTMNASVDVLHSNTPFSRLRRDNSITCMKHLILKICQRISSSGVWIYRASGQNAFISSEVP